MTLSRKLFLLAGCGLLVMVIALGLRPKALSVDLASARSGELRVVVRETGQTRVKDRYVISSPVQAYAPRIELEPGDPVDAGEALIVLEPIPASVLDARSVAEAQARVDRNRAALQSSESRLEAIATELELALHEFERLRPLHQLGTISASQFEQAETAHRRLAAEQRSASFDVEVARQDLRLSRAALEQQSAPLDAMQSFPILAPVSGQVLDVAHESAGVVQPGETLLTVADPASLEVIVELLSADAVRLEGGMPVELIRWGGETTLLGEVRLIERGGFTKVSALGVEEQRVVVVVDLVSPFEQWRQLGDGYRVEAVFVLWQQDDVVQVPIGAVFRHDDGWAVFRQEDGRARLQTVELGRWGESRVQIRSGLTVGDSIVAHPDAEITDGQRIRPFVR